MIASTKLVHYDAGNFPRDAKLGLLLQNGHLTFWYAAGIVIGSVLFIRGFGDYREFRVEEDTPAIPIRSIPMGFVHVRGEAQPGTGGLVLSPVGRTQCLSYKVDIGQWSGDAERGNWYHWKTVWGGPLFTLADSTGQVTVDVREAQLMVGQNTQAVAGGIGDSSVYDNHGPSGVFAGAPGTSKKAATATVPTDAELIEFAEAAPGGSLGGASGYYQFTEYVIYAGSSYDVVGTYLDNADSTESLEDLDRAAALKDPSYTPPPAPPPGRATDRKFIGKGKNERTFVISGDDEKTTQMELRHRAFMQVFGGAALAIACLALLLGQLGLMH